MEFMKSDNTELTDETVFSPTELEDLKKVDPVQEPEDSTVSIPAVEPEHEEVSPLAAPVETTGINQVEVVEAIPEPVVVNVDPQKEEEPKPAEVVEQPVVETPATEVVTPTSYAEPEEDEGTLGAFIRQKELEATPEYQAEQAKKKEIESKANSVEGIADIKKIATLSGTALNAISIIDTSKVAKPAPTAFKSKNPTYQVTLNQSAYIAHMEGLTFPDVFNINSSVANDYETALKKYKTYYEKMSFSSIGLKTFEEFARMTSLFDVDTLIFGILNQTFPGKIKYDITCRHCSKTMTNVGIPNDNLIVVKNDEVYEQVSKIISSIDSPEKADKYSLVNKIERIQLDDSKTILDIRIPTIEDHLNILAELRSVTNEQELIQASNFLLFIKAAYVLDPTETLAQGKPIFVEYKDRASILEIVRNMSIRDAGQANEVIEEKEEKYSISYAIQSFPCQNCQQEVGDVNVDVEELLFLESVQHFSK